jgi:hypothetical protein
MHVAYRRRSLVDFLEEASCLTRCRTSPTSSSNRSAGSQKFWKRSQPSPAVDGRAPSPLVSHSPRTPKYEDRGAIRLDPRAEAGGHGEFSRLTLDAFDFFLLVFVLKDIAPKFHTEISDVTVAILLPARPRSRMTGANLD